MNPLILVFIALAGAGLIMLGNVFSAIGIIAILTSIAGLMYHYLHDDGAEPPAPKGPTL